MDKFGLLLLLCAAFDGVSPASGAAFGQQKDAADAGRSPRKGRLIRRQHTSNGKLDGAEEDQITALVNADGQISYHSGVVNGDDQGDELGHNVSVFEERLADLSDGLDPTFLPNSSVLEDRSTWGRRRRRRRAGPVGPRGATGARGPPGHRGATGARGATGSRGATGARGPPGASTRGGTGARGSTGPKGAPGTRGATGAKGDKGDKGDSPKPIDCVWADWAAYSACTKTCSTDEDPGTQVRTRSFKVYPQNGGKSCEGPMFESAKCKAKACPTTTTITTTTEKAAKSSTVPLRANCMISFALVVAAAISLLP